MKDVDYMREALELAEKGRRATHPNPMVGAVVVNGDVIVGRGYHHGPGKPHAEIEALREAGPAAAGSTLYSTLEPCCHHGRTPPCTEAIIAAGVRRVVAAQRDPNPRVDGRGFAALRDAGIEVAELGGEIAAAAQRQNRAFLKYARTGLPFVTYKAAVSLDGKVAGASGDARWVSSPESRSRVHAMRASADAVLVGAETARLDDPELTVRDATGANPVRVVASHTGGLEPTSRLALTARETRTILLTSQIDDDHDAALRALGVEVLVGSLRGGLAALAHRGLVDVLCEGGPGLAAALLEEGLVDRLVVFVAPLLVGRGAPDLLAAPAVATLADARRLVDPVWSTCGVDAVLEALVAQVDETGEVGDDKSAGQLETGAGADRIARREGEADQSRGR